MVITEQALRADLERELHATLPDEAWNYLVSKSYVAEALDGLLSLRKLADEARAVLRAGGRTSRATSQTSPKLMAPRRARGATSRGEALSALMAAKADRNPGVIAFRKELLGSKLMQPDLIEGWVRERSSDDGPPTRWGEVVVPPGTKVVRDGGTTTLRPPIRAKTAAKFFARSLAYSSPTGWEVNVSVASGGVLDRLRMLSERLSRDYGWHEAHATNYVLTGWIPLRPPITVTHSVSWPLASGRISLSVDPSVSPRELRDSYSRARKAMVGARYRELSVKHLQLAAFCARRPEGETLAAQLKAWNAAYPKWRYSEVTNFGRDRSRAGRRLLEANYQLPVLEEQNDGEQTRVRRGRCPR